MGYFVVNQLPTPSPRMLDRYRMHLSEAVDRLNDQVLLADGRRVLRAEVDAIMFHVYGISRDDAAYILDTFPIVRRKDEAIFGEYLTRRLILENFDRLIDEGMAE